jgi:predicted TIM-barrel fold metal-dependent hydrolase
MNTRGQDKVMFATDFPFLTMDRCIAEVKALALSDEARAKYLYDNAASVLFKSDAIATT